MPDDLLTAAVFGDQTQALAARLHLEAAGIPAFLADELVAGSIFLWSPAVGGIKLQVPASRVEEAVRLLDEQVPGHWDDEPDAEVGEPDAAEPATPPGDTATAEDSEDVTSRERLAGRLSDLWILGLFVFPLLIVFIGLWLWILTSDERLRPEYARKARRAGAFVLVTTAAYVLVCWAICGAGSR